MDTRYSHPLVDQLWSTAWTYDAWLQIEAATLVVQQVQGIVPKNDELIDQLTNTQPSLHASLNIAKREETTKHDVAAFLQWIREEVLNKHEDGRWVHFGLTSSDVVDTAQGMRFRAMHRPILSALGNVISELTRLVGDDTALIGRTHGQPAELITMRARAYGWTELLATGATELSRRTSRMAVCKLSGTVGTYAHNPPEVERGVAMALNLQPHGPGATQIVPRARLAAWANAANLTVQACAKIAHDVRLMGLLGETTPVQTEGQVGSSAMAHKINPIRAEKIAGMARMATGYASMLSDLGTWLERDISQSSVERVAVPDLWHVTMHTIEQTTLMLRELQLDQQAIEQGIRQTPELLVHTATLDLIRGGFPIEDARRLALMEQNGIITTPDDAEGAMRNYPSTR